MDDFNATIIAEFRANRGVVGGPFEGMPMVLVHHVGRNSGIERVNPLVSQPAGPDSFYIFASAAGAPTDPQWYRNLTCVDRTTVEVGTETFDVTIEEITGTARDEVYARQAALFSGFAGYAEKTAGIRTIPVLKLTRV